MMIIHDEDRNVARGSAGHQDGSTAVGAAALGYGMWLLYLLVLLNIVIPGTGLTAAGTHDPVAVLPWVRAHPGLFTLLWVPELLASLLLVGVVVALDARLGGPTAGRMRVASAYGILGGVFVTGHTLVQNALIPLASLQVRDRVAADAAFRAVDAIGGWLTQGGLFALGLWMLAAGWTTLRTGALPRWTGYGGLLAGALCVLALFLGIPLGMLGLLLWSFALGISLLGRGMRAQPAQMERAAA
jgi:hypothetical protein